jgi:hypothetical protein
VPCSMPTAAKRARRASGSWRAPSAPRCSRVGRLRAPGMCPQRGSYSSGVPAKRSAARASMTTSDVAAVSSMSARRPAGHGVAVNDAGDAAVEQRRLVTGHAQHPHQAGGDRAAVVVVAHDRVVVADPQRGHRLRERLGRGEGVAAGVARRRRQIALEVDPDRAGEVAAVVGGAAGASIEVPAHVADHDLVETRRQPVRVDERREHQSRSTSTAPVDIGCTLRW